MSTDIRTARERQRRLQRRLARAAREQRLAEVALHRIEELLAVTR